MKISKLVVNKKKRQIVNKYELKQIFLKFFFFWLSLKKVWFSGLIFLVLKLFFVRPPIKAYFSSVRNVCLLSGRTKSVMSMYKLSRIKFNEFMAFGLIPGWKKSSW